MKIRHDYRRHALIAAATLLSFIVGCKKETDESIDKTIENSETSVTAATGRTFTLGPDANGRLVIDNKSGTYKAGDIINLKGNFKAVFISNMSGTAAAPIKIQNASGTVATIGDPSWTGSSGYPGAFSFDNCHYIKLGSPNGKNYMVINGATTSVREAYFNIHLGKHTDNFEIYNLSMNNGGTGIVAKTEPVKGDASTAYPNSTMYNLSIHGISINNTRNEAMYIGHTATYWDLTAGVPYYGTTSGMTAGHQYVEPIKWYNVLIYGNTVSNSGLDGIQTAAIDKLEVHSNVVTNWATQHNTAHNGGILIGGRTTNTNTHDNIVRSGWGELYQFYGSGTAHVVKNNLFADNESDGVSMRGAGGAAVQFVNNTVANVKGNTLRINGYSGQTGKNIVNNNVFIAPLKGVGTIYPKYYIYLENGAVVTEGTGTLANFKFATIAASGVSATNYYQVTNTTLTGGLKVGYVNLPGKM
ncbi:right-handed parallel beta-helix repeat-containing protein [Chitinophaga pinensis]|uniref:Right-handed parallel beta-helix repeat-containing protein n=1 Tax=Chitinophaga pinensis TaxID=79329 RepID=A0A5C6LQD2_9BACT|nr:right-handed parallel beta-helix repeat-containing protein [Chitinophaga pinensis]TWV98843.1 right-handed parallel beta-helix repeat-containing protein [Chitinophaga pinensis]